MDRKAADAVILAAVKNSKGIVRVAPFLSEDRGKIVDIEADAEERSLMGLGKVINTGVIEVLKCDCIYVALNNMDFDWGRHATLVMKKGEEVVGKEVRDEQLIAELSTRKDVWFMHKNFVVYKSKMQFPQDIMKKIVHFEIPPLPAEWCHMEDAGLQCRSIIYANPATPADIFLKEQYFHGLDQRGLGTILIGLQE